jgi:hypothetical protein
LRSGTFAAGSAPCVMSLTGPLADFVEPGYQVCSRYHADILRPGICASDPLECVARATRRAKHLLFSRSVSSAVRKNICLCENRNIDYIPHRPASTTRTFRPIVTLTWGGMRWTRERKTNCADAYGQAVWSCPPDAGVNPRVEEPGETEANKPGTPGRSRSSRSTIAQGVPDVSALPVVTTACVHHYPSCTRGCGCGQRPAFPAPSFSRATCDAKPGREIAPRECGFTSSPLSWPASSGPSSIPEASQLSTAVSGILGRPVKPGDDRRTAV